MKLVDVLHDAISEPDGGASTGRLVFLGSAVTVLGIWSAVVLIMIISMARQHADVSHFQMPTVPIEILTLVLGAGTLKVVQRVKAETTTSTDTTASPVSKPA